MYRNTFSWVVTASVMIFGGAVSGMAKTYCVGPSATGNGSGSDWANLKAFSSSFTARGDTWYLVGGTYPGATFSQQASGTLTNTILKATASNFLNVTPTGWASTMANQAQFNGLIGFQSSYWIFDGQTRNINNWFDSTGYGFQINGQNIPVQLWISMGQSSTPCEYIRVSYVDAEGLTDQSWTGAQPSVFYTENGNDNGVHNRGIEFSYCHINNGNNGIKVPGTQGCMVQYNAIENLWGTSTWHGDGINVYYCDLGGGTIRYNKLRNLYVNGGGTGGVTCYDTGTTSGTTEIYGNTFYRIAGEAVVPEYNPSGANYNIHVYNNTMVDCGANGVHVGNTWSGNNVYNNLIIGTGPNGYGYTMLCNVDDYNAYPSGGGFSEPHGEYDIDYTIFVNYTNQDFRLTRNTSPGLNLGSPYNVDADGNARTTWSRGAYEFNGTAPDPSISVQPQSQSVAAGASATFNVQATGKTALSYQWNWFSTNVSGATGSTWTTPPLTSNQGAGQVYVVVRDAAGSVTSSVVNLTVTGTNAPAITSQPQSQTVASGNTATFSVVSQGAQPLSYQWYYRGTVISGATASSYSHLQNMGDNGATFYATVSNSYGAVQSASAVLTVVNLLAPTNLHIVSSGP
jgi:hypothetical protein